MIDFGFFRLEETGTHKGRGFAFRCFIGKRFMGIFSSVDEAVEAMMNPFNPIFMNDLDDFEFDCRKADIW